MPVSGTQRRLDVWMNFEFVGSWFAASRREHRFRYSDAWLQSPSARPLSLSLPLHDPGGVVSGEAVEAYFDNLLPDSSAIRERVRTRFRASSTAAFDLLQAIGRDCVGAVQLLPAGMRPEAERGIRGVPLNEADVARHLRSVPLSPAFGGAWDDDFRISIAGAQEKTALLRHGNRWRRPLGTTPTTHIFKLPLGTVGPGRIDLTRSVENEWLCMQLVAAFGLPAAECSMECFEEQRALVVRRFDRRLAADRSWIIRLPQEDMCQATATPSTRKYEADGGPGIESIMRLLLGSRTAAEDRRMFFRAQVLFWMLCAIDGHAKNFSVFLEAGGRYTFTPLYDVLSAYPVLGKGQGRIAPQDLRMAMSVSGKNKHYGWKAIIRRHWSETAKRCGIGAQSDDIINALVARAPAALEQTNAALPADFPSAVADPILQGVRRAAATLAR